ncbi:hypothetical protein RPIT_14235 [Tessaracoccus flavus]|uniref:Type II secretion system protein GspF domain-containing protein n=1 Tax=Tessaracoccus flavus TaxID=1610493 RepID=A0A1Q2CI66_9ACTN|nr:hypothetical protein RPIT_14235 [Tessaracoccus flavus]
MEVMLAALAGSMIVAGAIAVVVGARRAVREPSTALSTGLWTRIATLWRGLPRAHRLWVVVSVGAGVLAAVASGWLLALVLLPAVAIVVPLLLSAPPNREVEVLAGLDRWVRVVATSLSSGKSIRDAVFSTRHQVPDVLADPVARLCTRLDQRWTMRDALFAMADELESADADAVVAALAIAASKGGAGARATLGALSDSIQDRLRALREIASERAKPRAVVRQVTLITLTVLAAAILFNGRFFEPYTTPLGQIIAVALAATYLGCLLMLRRLTVPPPAPRFLRSQA